MDACRKESMFREVMQIYKILKTQKDITGSNRQASISEDSYSIDCLSSHLFLKTQLPKSVILL